MTGRIYLLRDDGKLEPLDEQSYDSEALLQQLLASYPDILAGEQMDESAPRRWLLISREVGVPGEEGGGDRWSVDHVFLDQDGIPTLVEVKRSSDTRIRREVVGQMLDYAANAVLYWPVETIRARFEAECDTRDEDPAQRVAELIEASSEDDAAVEDFWVQVKTNLQAGRVRLVFVADEIPAELRRVVEFLNAQMDPAEVFAVEISQYVGGGLKTLVSRVIGQTAEAETKKSGGRPTGKQWTWEEFLGAIRKRHPEEVVSVIVDLYQWSTENANDVPFGSGRRHGTFAFQWAKEGRTIPIFHVYTSGIIILNYGRLFGVVDQAYIQEFHNAITAIPGFDDIPADFEGKWPERRIEDTLARSPEALDRFKQAVLELAHAGEAERPMR